MLLDINMPVNGLAVLRQVHEQRADCPVVMVSGSVEIDDAIASFRAGARHFVRKPFRTEEFLAIAQEALAQGGVIDRRVRAAAASELHLTEKEQKVLTELAAGSQSKTAAWNLQMSVRTVEMYRSRLIKKLGARNTLEALANARSLGLVA